MPLVDAKCKNCGATVKVEDDRKEAFCPYCGAKYLVEQAIEYYNVTNVNNIQVSAKGDAEKERLLKNAKTYIELQEIWRADQIYNEIIEDYPDDYRGWYGKAQILSRQFKKLNCDIDEFEKISLYDFRARKFADEKASMEIKNEWNEYVVNLIKEQARIFNYEKDEFEGLEKYVSKAISNTDGEVHGEIRQAWDHALAETISKQISLDNHEPKDFEKLERFVAKAMNSVGEDTRAEIRLKWESFLFCHNSFIESKKVETHRMISDKAGLENQLSRNKARLNSEIRTRDKLNKKRQSVSGNHKGDIPLLIFGTLLFIIGLIGCKASVHSQGGGGASLVSISSWFFLFFIATIVGIILFVAGLTKFISNRIHKQYERKYINQKAICDELMNRINAEETELAELEKNIRVIRGVYKI